MINIYTDGGCINNGKTDAKAKYAFIIANIEKNTVIHKENGPVNKHNCRYSFKNKITEIVYMPSSIRAELLALVKGLEKSKELKLTIANLYTDSLYCFNIMTKWLKKWITEKTIHKKSHIDLLIRLIPFIDIGIKFNHINSHQPEPKDPIKKIHWKFNDAVDKMCEF